MANIATSISDTRDITSDDFTAANQVLVGSGVGTYTLVTIGASQILGRGAAGSTTNLTAANVRTIINVEDGADVTDTANVTSAGALMASSFTAADEIMVGTGAGTTVQVTLAASQFLAKKATGTATNVTAAEARTILQTTGYASLWVSVEEFRAPPAGGPAPDVRTLSNGITVKGWLFNPAAEQTLHAHVNMPDDWDLGTVKAKVYWSTTESPSAADVVRWGVSGVAVSNDDALNASYGTEVTVDDAVIAVGDLHVSGATGAVTIGGTPALGDGVALKVARKAAAAEDTMNEEDALFLGIAIQYGTLAATPSAW